MTCIEKSGNILSFGTGSDVNIKFTIDDENIRNIANNKWKILATFTGTHTNNRKLYFHEPPASHYFRKNPYVDIPWYIFENNASSPPTYTVIVNDPVYCIYTANVQLS